MARYYPYNSDVDDLSRLLGVTFTAIEKTRESERDGQDNLIIFKTDDGRTFHMAHVQDCCEDVYIEDIVGDLEDLIGNPLLQSERVTNRDDKPVSPAWDTSGTYTPDSYTWTYFKFATIKGSVTIRWFGESNGYYSEDASMYEVKDNADE